MMSKFGLKRRIFSNRDNKIIATIIGIILTPILLGDFIFLDIHPFFKELSHPSVWLAVSISILFIAPYAIRELVFRKRRNNIMDRSIEKNKLNAL